MATTLGEVIVKFGADTSAFSAGVLIAMSNMNTFEKAVVGSVFLVDAALVAVGVTTVKMAGDFQQSTTRIVTGAGLMSSQLDKVRSGILSISQTTGVMTDQLSMAMYHIQSVLQSGAKGLDALSVSARGSVIEQANVVDVANAVAGALHNFSNENYTALQVMNGYIEGVKRGNVTLQDLSTSIGQVQLKANEFGVSFADLTAAMTTQTAANISANIAATGLRFLLQSLEVPTTKASNAMKQYGVNSKAVADEMRVSLPGALQMVADAAAKSTTNATDYNRAVSDMIGGQRSLSAYLALTGTHMKDFSANSKDISAAMSPAIKDMIGWSDAQKNLNVQGQILMANLQVLGIVIGTKLLPYVLQFIQFITPLIAGITNWISTGDNLKNLMIGLAVVMGGLTLAAVVILGAAIVAAGGVLLAFSGISVGTAAAIAVLGGVVVFVAIKIIQNWNSVKGAVGGVFSALGSGIRWLQDVWISANNAITYSIQNPIQAVQHMGSIIGDIFSNLAGGAFNWGANMIGGFIGGIKSMIGGVANAASSAAQTAANFLAHHSPAKMGPMSDSDKWAPNLMKMLTQGIIAGTPAFQTALAHVGAGGVGQPSNVNVIGGAGGSGAQTIILQVDGRDLASALGNNMANEIRLTLGIK